MKTKLTASIGNKQSDTAITMARETDLPFAPTVGMRLVEDTGIAYDVEDVTLYVGRDQHLEVWLGEVAEASDKKQLKGLIDHWASLGYRAI